MNKKRFKIPAAKVYVPDADIPRILTLYRKILKNGQLAWGNYNTALEEGFARYVGTRYAVTANSGASALELILRARGITGKEVIVPTNTNFATAAAVVLSGGKPVFCDCDSYNLSPRPDQIGRCITKKTAGFIIVHIGGIITPDIDAIAKLCKDKGIFFMEDASHAHSSLYDGRKAGRFSEFSAFSMFGSKVITCGEGGIITTDSKKIRDLCESLRNQGKEGGNNDVHYRMGSTYRVTEFQAILGIYQLKRVIEFRKLRERIALFYDRELAGSELIRPFLIPGGVTSSYYKYIAWIDKSVDREKLKKTLKEKYDIALSAPVYKVPCHLQPVFKGIADPGGNFKEAEYFCDNHICLPISSAMTRDEAAYVVESVKKALSRGGNVFKKKA
ncbi:MAG: DegT/DnrJ/EryC1/StrS family aminotransferase [Candidatus Omnitrophica bacterium]|nr:DegT/DnrJ/EryC1/StrS family aminotransferase [Candidatus Omnitrophota bacterium]